MDFVQQLRKRASYEENGAELGEAMERIRDDAAGLLNHAADLIEEFVPANRRKGATFVRHKKTRRP